MQTEKGICANALGGCIPRAGCGFSCCQHRDFNMLGQVPIYPVSHKMYPTPVTDEKPQTLAGLTPTKDPLQRASGALLLKLSQGSNQSHDVDRGDLKVNFNCMFRKKKKKRTSKKEHQNSMAEVEIKGQVCPLRLLCISYIS